MPYYYDKDFVLRYEPRLMMIMTRAERDEYLDRRAYMLCVDCCAPADVHDRCSSCEQRYADAGYPEMYASIHDTDPSEEYVEKMRNNEFVRLNLQRFARRVRNTHQKDEAH